MARSRRYGGRPQHNNRGHNNARQKQNASKNLERYLNMAKDAAANGDVHQAENYYQHADHYYRIAHANDDSPQQRQQPSDDSDSNVNNEENAVSQDQTQPLPAGSPQPEVPQDYKPATDSRKNNPEENSDQPAEKPKRKYTRRKPVTDASDKSTDTTSEEPVKPKRKYTRRKPVEAKEPVAE